MHVHVTAQHIGYDCNFALTLQSTHACVCHGSAHIVILLRLCNPLMHVYAMAQHIGYECSFALTLHV